MPTSFGQRWDGVDHVLLCRRNKESTQLFVSIPKDHLPFLCYEILVLSGLVLQCLMLHAALGTSPSVGIAGEWCCVLMLGAGSSSPWVSGFIGHMHCWHWICQTLVSLSDLVISGDTKSLKHWVTISQLYTAAEWSCLLLPKSSSSWYAIRFMYYFFFVINCASSLPLLAQICCVFQLLLQLVESSVDFPSE